MDVFREIRRRLQWPLAALIALPGLLVVACLPRCAVLWLSRALGRAAYRLVRRDREVAHANLDLAFGDALTFEQKRAVAQASFASFALVFLDLAWFALWRDRRLDRWVHMDASVQTMKVSAPVVFALAHYGNWEVMGQSVCRRGFQNVSVARPQQNWFADALLNHQRQATGQRIVPVEGALRSLVSALRKGASTSLLVDQNLRLSEGGVQVDFFGVPVEMSNAASVLALRLKREIWIPRCVADADGRYQVDVRRLAIRADDTPEAVTQRIAAVFEADIRARPEPWVWMYKRWKRFTAGADRLRYPFYAHEYGKPGMRHAADWDAARRAP